MNHFRQIRKVILFLMAACFMSAAYAQRISVSGTVLDAGNNEPSSGLP